LYGEGNKTSIYPWSWQLTRVPDLQPHGNGDGQSSPCPIPWHRLANSLNPYPHMIAIDRSCPSTSYPLLESQDISHPLSCRIIS
jgi:hypothetical protein